MPVLVFARNHPVLLEAHNNGTFNFDSANNGILLPNSPEAAAAARAEGIDLPYHRGSHPRYTAEVDRIIREELDGVDSSDAAAIQDAINEIDRRAREALTEPQFIDDTGKLI